MPKIRVLIVDDAVVVRKIVSDVLAEDSDIEIVGTAANGKIALQKIPQCNPDIITLDFEMPEMDGLTTLKKARELYPNLPIIMFSTLTERGAAVTLEALQLGATDYVTKPANVGSVSVAKERVKSELIEKIKCFCRRVRPAEPTTRTQTIGALAPKRSPAPALAFSPTKAFEILAIGVSTGGPNALAELIPALPADFPVPIVLVQHMPPLFTKMLAERLTAKSKLIAVEAQAGMTLERGKIYIAPGDFHMKLVRRDAGIGITLNQEQPENSCRPAVDPLFRSVVEIYKSSTLGLILTGMGQDGMRGCEYIKEAGGYVIAQDQASSVVWGMPGAVVEAGLADQILPLNQIAAELTRRCKGAINRTVPQVTKNVAETMS